MNDAENIHIIITIYHKQ